MREGEREFDFEKAEDEHRPLNPPQDNGVPDVHDDDGDGDGVKRGVETPTKFTLSTIHIGAAWAQ